MPSPVPGLTSADAAARLRRDGPNVLPPPRQTPWWRKLGAQFVHFFALMLWVAGVLALVAGMPQLAVAIYVVVVINGVFAFVQEHRAERAAGRLRDLLPRTVTVMRDGRRQSVDASELVVGDLIWLDAGDRISADARLTEAHGLSVDVSSMTGESVPVTPAPGDTVHAGTFVTEGEAAAVITAVGGATDLAQIARLTQDHHRPSSPLARELHRVVTIIARVAVGVGLGFFALSLLLGTDLSEGFVFAIGVTVALVPEGLLPTVTLSLAVGAQRMAAHHALVRRLESVETLGSTTFICTDKTGTLTRNLMEVVEVWTPAGTTTVSGSGYSLDADVQAEPSAIDAARTAASIGRACSSGRVVVHDGEPRPEGDPMEAAIDALWHRLGADDLDAAAAVRRRLPFDPRRKRMSVVLGDELVLKGAPETVLPRCRPAGTAGAQAALDDAAGRGLRVLALARRPARPADVDPGVPADDVEHDLELVGLAAFEDPPRSQVHEAIARCRRAGIRVAMLTGDHPETGAAIAQQVGLSQPGSPVFESHELPDDDVALGELLDHDGVVIARVEPETKLRIARALQGRGHVVAMTGDGVNDGPALQQADIGIAMGRSGTDVAREASDLVLLDDDFATIVRAVELGRATFLNLRRFLTYHLTDNVAELTPFVIWALTGGWVPLAIGVLQILFLDIGTDVLPALALGIEPPGDGTLDRPPLRGHLLDRSVLTRAFGLLGPVEAVVEMSAFFAAALATGWRPGLDMPTGTALAACSGAALAAVVVGQAANAYACRSTSLPPWRIHRPNPLLRWAVAVELVLLVAVLTIAPVADLLGHAVPPPAAWPVIALAVPAVLGADALAKRGRRSRPDASRPRA